MGNTPKTIMLLACVALLTSTAISARNPFCFGKAIPQLCAIGMLDPKNGQFALLSFENRNFYVFPGENFMGYKIISIERDTVILKDLKNKKALQLKI